MENVVQIIARDVFVEDMQRLEAISGQTALVAGPNAHC
jgi:hypothetical protein